MIDNKIVVCRKGVELDDISLDFFFQKFRRISLGKIKDCYDVVMSALQTQSRAVRISLTCDARQVVIITYKNYVRLFYGLQPARCILHSCRKY